mgnify:FL=1
MEEKVLLVNEKDQVLGEMEKIEAHEKGLLHRAFSVFIYNDKNELLLQRRALSKYHTPGLWTNTCCSHQRENETNIEAGERRLQEEMGFTTDLENQFSFIYKAPFSNGMTEHEYDHILKGVFNGTPLPNPNEVAEWKWVTLDHVEKDISENPDNYTAWFKILLEKYLEKLRNNQ